MKLTLTRVVRAPEVRDNNTARITLLGDDGVEYTISLTREAVSDLLQVLMQAAPALDPQPEMPFHPVKFEPVLDVTPDRQALVLTDRGGVSLSLLLDEAELSELYAALQALGRRISEQSGPPH